MIIDTSNWGWPQWLYLSLMLVGLIVHAYMNGKPRVGKYEFGPHLVAVLISIFILTKGGFFK